LEFRPHNFVGPYFFEPAMFPGLSPPGQLFIFPSYYLHHLSLIAYLQ
jgi:hypothetical protein